MTKTKIVQSYSQSAALTGVDIKAEIVEWDTLALGKIVAKIDHIDVRQPSTDAVEGLLAWFKEQGVSLVSCRLGIDELVSSMWLEDIGFRFVEMIVHPTLTISSHTLTRDDEIQVAEVSDSELDEIASIARSAFQNERFHVDHRIDTRAANERYANWVVNSHTDSSQKLVKLVKGHSIIGFFIFAEHGKKIDWLLTAIAPAEQGNGLGYDAWRRMLRFHEQAGFCQVTTSITVKNIAVMNLYRKLGFTFSEPEMTFHLVRS